MRIVGRCSSQVLIDSRVINSLRHGSCFGEQSLLHKTTTVASVIAVSYCELYQLHRRAFDQLADQFTKTFEGFKQAAKLQAKNFKKRERILEQRKAKAEAAAEAKADREEAESFKQGESATTPRLHADVGTDGTKPQTADSFNQGSTGSGADLSEPSEPGATRRKWSGQGTKRSTFENATLSALFPPALSELSKARRSRRSVGGPRGLMDARPQLPRDAGGACLVYPWSRARAVWGACLLLCLNYELLLLPVKLVFVGNAVDPTLTALDALTDLVLFADVWLRFYLAMVDDGRVVSDRKLLRARYCKVPPSSPSYSLHASPSSPSHPWPPLSLPWPPLLAIPCLTHARWASSPTSSARSRSRRCSACGPPSTRGCCRRLASRGCSGCSGGCVPPTWTCSSSASRWRGKHRLETRACEPRAAPARFQIALHSPAF